MKKWTLEQKMENCIKLQKEITEMYELVNMLFIICLRKGLRLIMENPYSKEHYLYRYWCYKPSIVDTDRRLRGDYYAKPTQYWFLNCKPEFNFVLKALPYNSLGIKDAIRTIKKCDIEHTGAKTIKVARSMIHPQYAERFIEEYILDAEGKVFKESEK
jgi:hypothetical protein